MVEFGAKLSLKDNMSATLQKNVKMQQDFSRQVKETDSSIQGLGKRKANPIIQLRDMATANLMGIKRDLRAMSNERALTRVEVEGEAMRQVDEITKKLNRLKSMVASPFIKVKDAVSAKVDNVKAKLKQIATTFTPIVKLRDAVSTGLAKIKNTLGWLGKTAITPVIKIHDGATKVLNKTKVALNVVGKIVAKPFIQIKDKANPIINKVKNGLKIVGKTVAKAGVAIKDGASAIIGKVKDGLKAIGSTVAKATVALKDGATAGLKKIKDMLGSLAKGVTIGVTVAGAGLTALAGASIGEGAKLQQSIGGVETLFGARGAKTVYEYAKIVGKSASEVQSEFNTLMKSQKTVLDNADKAYRTAGLSANAYMETVTSFSASLLQSLGGDTLKSAEIADMAIIDMADNANKFGTDMSSIQTAYQGFAKQNYTMLDNLKLGYGGTKEEMQRLLKDAQKLSGVKYNINNLADVYNAIHVIQKDLGVAGATAQEASSTFTGSFNAMKASAQNLLGNLAIGGDVTGSMKELVSSAMTFLAGNLLPMVSNILSALPSAISTGIKSVAPKLKTVGKDIAKALKDGIIGFLPSSMQGVANNLFSSLGRVFNSVTGMLSSVSSRIAEKFGGMFGDGGGIFDGIASAVEMAMPTVGNLLVGIADVVGAMAPVLGSLGQMFASVMPSILGVVDAVIPMIVSTVSWLGTALQEVMPVVSSIISVFANTVQQLLPIVGEIFSSVGAVVMPIVQSLAGLIQSAMPIISSVISVVVGALQSVMPTFTKIFDMIGSKVQAIVAVVQKHMPLISSIFNMVAGVVSSAIKIISNVLSGLCDFLSPIIDIIIGVLDFLLTGFEKVFPTIQNIVETVWSALEKVFGWISDGLSMVGDAIKGVGDFIGGGLDAIGNFFGFAYGKDRVPYDNYPAVLHQGEKVLTRNQADQYDRQMSTRGVQLSKAVEEVPRDTNNTSVGTVTSVPTELTQVNTGNTVTIEKLAETIVIEKEADVDKVVEDMIIKFRKLLPNMS